MKRDPLTIVIFGASGDLTKRKLVPALFSLFRKGRLPEKLKIVGYGRSDLSRDEFRDLFDRGTGDIECKEPPEMKNWEDFLGSFYYCQGRYSEEDDIRRLEAFLSDIETGPADRLYYFAIPPGPMTDIVVNLGRCGMTEEDRGWRRVVAEKPFGHDLESARGLNRALHNILQESQIYRIDHYLGKETVQNVLVFRFGNTIFEPVWNRNHIDHVQITIAEEVDVGHRAGYYDKAGALRDMFQNHMLQMLSLVAMEPPASFNADAIRNEKVKLFSAIRPITGGMVASETVRGQYEGYRGTPGVNPESTTETYAALRVFIDNWRWNGVPFYLRSGKALRKKSSEVLIQFREPPHFMFPYSPEKKITANYLSLCVQPNEGIHLRFEAKVPDTTAETRSVNMSFYYNDSFGACAVPDAYERLLLDAIIGDASLFTRSDGIEASWKFIDEIIKGWEAGGAPSVALYKPGSWGPAEADAFLSKDGRSWAPGCTGINSEGVDTRGDRGQS
jgi:glucose-6-phosphate 1-dehydrogenase